MDKGDGTNTNVYLHRDGTLNANYCKLGYVRGQKIPKNANVICERPLNHFKLLNVPILSITKV